MKKQGKVILICKKKLNCGVMDMFEVVVKTADKDSAKKNYESMGYTVSVRK